MVEALTPKRSATVFSEHISQQQEESKYVQLLKLIQIQHAVDTYLCILSTEDKLSARCNIHHATAMYVTINANKIHCSITRSL